ncbi:MAG: CRISPR-associated endonuclease Cas1 [Xenococcaceae cyanobacterium]
MDFSLARLIAAWEQVRTRTKVAGIDGITTDLFAGVVLEELRRLQWQLQGEKYAPNPAKGFYLKKKSGGYRLIGISTVRDRIIQRFILQSVYPALEEVFRDCSYAYRPGLGVQTAIAHLSELYAARPTWVIKADISQFFDSLCWTLLLTQLEGLSIESVMVRLVEQQIKSGIVVNRQKLRWTKGVLQGGILSGALANLYLSDFDARCLDLGINLVRYGDDFVIVTQGLLEARRILNLIHYWLEDIYLTFQPEKTKIVAPHEEFKFLGYWFKAGEVIEPERKLPKPRHKSKTARINEPSRPPRACSLVKARQVIVPSNFHHYWSENMTTLYITAQGTYIKVKRQQFQVYHNSEMKVSVPVNRVSHIVIFGCCNLSHVAVKLTLQRQIPVMFLSQRGHYFGRLQAEGMAEIDYLAKQVERLQDSEFILRQAKTIVGAKLNNSRVLLLRLNRKKRTEAAIKAVSELAVSIEKVTLAESLESLLGYEGQGARIYFQALGSLFNEPFKFTKRTRRPPTEPVSSLLSLGYTLLFQNMYSLVQAVGLHPHFGNLHVPRKNHPALVSDLIEEFRAPIVDSLVMYLVNSKILKPEDFTPPDARGGVYLYPDALKKYLKHWQERLQAEVTHTHTGYKVSNHRCFELQIWEYIACLMGEQESYRPIHLSV